MIDHNRIRRVERLLRDVSAELAANLSDGPQVVEACSVVRQCIDKLNRVLAANTYGRDLNAFHSGLIDGSRDRSSLPMRSDLDRTCEAYQAGYRIGYAGKKVRV